MTRNSRGQFSVAGEQHFARCGDCKRTVRLGADLHWAGRVAWTEEADPITGRTRYYCRPCAVRRFDVAEYDVAQPAQTA